ncbi:unnamed protein product [Fusarium graminearum]|uniref:F-box domain-containing protein n=1 Tax=Gibberella zeae TaxID=5518 RepID=A0A9N8NDJ5_GIBZA|nr:unnamed protein product [Fusarium graminearum]
MDTLHQACFSIFIIVWAYLTICNLVVLFRKSAVRFSLLRFWSIIPLGLYGPLVVLYPWWRLGHLDRGRQFLGIWLVLWPIVSSIIASQSKTRGSMGEWHSCQRSRGPFYILCVDWAIIFFIIVESCRYPIPTGTKDWTFGGGLGKVMGVFVILLLALQDVLLFPIAAFPRYVTAPAVIICRSFLPAKTKPRVTKWPFLFEDLLSKTRNHDEKLLAAVLRDDSIIERVARHLHYDDIVNLSLTSKLMRTAIFHPSTETSHRQSRVESLCVSSCVDGQKSECWSCDRVICAECTDQRSDIIPSRVKGHFANCYAVCTYCYLMSAPGGGAPFQAKRNMQDLELQHINCCAFQKPLLEDDTVSLCRYCAALDRSNITAMREARDEFYLSKTLPMNVDCAICMATLSTRRSRWWFCSRGRHDYPPQPPQPPPPSPSPSPSPEASVTQPLPQVSPAIPGLPTAHPAPAAPHTNTPTPQPPAPEWSAFVAPTSIFAALQSLNFSYSAIRSGKVYMDQFATK